MGAMNIRDEAPGRFPFTRGIYEGMYRGRLWTMRQYAGFGTARETNRRLRKLAAEGQTGLSLAFDLPTQLGFDPDDPRAAGEVGVAGVSAATEDELAAVLKGIPLAETSVSMTVNATAPAMLAFLAAAAEREGIGGGILRGTIQNDMLKEYSARNLYRLPPEPAVKMAVDAIEFCVRHLPRFYPISVSGYHLREAGAGAAQEIGFAAANALYYAEMAMRRGLKADEVLPRITFFFSSGCDVLREAAKFRAARRLWAKLARSRLGAARPESLRMKIHAQTAGSELSAMEIDNNIVRVTLQALAAVFGGVQSLHTNARDEAWRLPTASSALLALRTQQILAYESGICDIPDPLGGAPAIENETDRLEEEALRWVEAVDRAGGALQAAASGFVRDAVRASAYRDFLAVENGERSIVGVNRFGSERVRASLSPSFGRAHSCAEEVRAAEAVRRHRAARSEADARRALDAVLRDAQSGANTMSALFHAARCGVTVGEIYGALTNLFGGFRMREPETETAAIALKRPVILIAKAGMDGHDRGAVMMVKALRDEGFSALFAGIRRSPEEIAAQAAALGADCVGISSLSGAHRTAVPQIAAALNASGWHGLIIAGGIIPEEDEAVLREAGVRAVFRPHTRPAEVAAFLRRALNCKDMAQSAEMM